jgi:hypothetical protein
VLLVNGVDADTVGVIPFNIASIRHSPVNKRNGNQECHQGSGQGTGRACGKSQDDRGNEYQDEKGNAEHTHLVIHGNVPSSSFSGNPGSELPGKRVIKNPQQYPAVTKPSPPGVSHVE